MSLYHFTSGIPAAMLFRMLEKSEAFEVLKPYDLMLLLWVITRAAIKGKNTIDTTITQMQTETKLDRRTLKGTLSRLQGLGWLSWTRSEPKRIGGGRRKAKYIITFRYPPAANHHWQEIMASLRPEQAESAAAFLQPDDFEMSFATFMHESVPEAIRGNMHESVWFEMTVPTYLSETQDDPHLSFATFMHESGRLATCFPHSIKGDSPQEKNPLGRQAMSSDSADAEGANLNDFTEGD